MEGIETLRPCEECSEPLSPKRLLAQPGATMCVPCLEALGDVPRIKRYDDFNEQLETVAETYFVSDPYIEGRISKLMNNSHTYLGEDFTPSFTQ